MAQQLWPFQPSRPWPAVRTVMMRQTQPTSTIGGYEDINMKNKIYVLSTVLADENGPAMPAVFADSRKHAQTTTR